MSLMRWETVWASLEWDRQDHEHVAHTLAQRAEKYATPPPLDAEGDDDVLRALVFTQAQERCALPAQFVLRGIAQPRLTPLPCVPVFYRGVINLRGRILSVLDLRRFWGFATPSLPESPRLIVVRAANRELALLADDVLELIRIPISAIIPPMTAGIGLAHVQGLSPDGLVIVDIESLLADPRLFVHDEV